MNIVFGLIFSFTIIALFLLGLVFYIKNQYRRGGKKLIALPLSKTRRFIYLALGVLLFIIACSSSIFLTIIGSWLGYSDLADNNGNLTAIVSGAMGGIAANLWLRVFLPTEFRANGIVFFGSLIKWSRIRSYEWKSLENLRLKVKSKHLNWRWKWKLKVPSAKRERVEQILIEKISY